MGRKSSIKVTKPHPDTGEVLEDTLRPGDIRPPLPKYPILDEEWIGFRRPKGRRLRTARGVLYKLEHDERVIEFWLAQPNVLTREERREILENATIVTRPSEFEPTWQKGDELEVAYNLTAVVRDVTHMIDGWRTRLLVRDFRAVFVKRSPGSSSPPKTDEHGNPLPPSPEEISAARIDGSYTSSQALAVPETGEEITGDLHRRLHREQSMSDALKRGKQRVRMDRHRLERRLNEARKKNWRGTVRYLERVKRERGWEDKAA